MKVIFNKTGRFLNVIVYFILILQFSSTNAQVRDTWSDTWVAVDDLNRASPNNSLTGNLKANKTVGLFYYIWQKETVGWPIKDISKILAGQDTWGPAPLFHHYGESVYNYYSSADEFVIRKHMQMFADANIDYIFLDNTNGPSNTYEAVYKKIFTILDDMKAKGVKTPKVAFVVNTDMDATIEKIFADLYTQNLYSQHWFQWQGKPLLLGKYTGSNSNISNFFTYKQSWAWTSQPWYTENGGKNKWPWLEDYPQKAGLDGNGAVEQMSVTAAQHPHGQFAIGKSTGADRTQAPVMGTDGKYFGLQWDKALQVNPQMIMITQWNEWIAQRFIKGDPNFSQPVDYMARQPIPNGASQFIDVYTPEYSRDLEPMRTGYRDNMYLQMANNIRKYKGSRPYRTATNPTSITINNTFSQWANVGPLYLDDIGDVKQRNHTSFGSNVTYTNTTGRNDIEEMKISFDNTYVYFYVKTQGNLTPSTDARWMNLLINSDANYNTGWEGYDYIVNNTVKSTTSTTLKKNSGSTYTWGTPLDISYSFNANEMHVRIPASSLGINPATAFTLDFKWVDNSIQTGDIIDLYSNGEAAPNNRYNYRYSAAGTGLTAWEFNQAGNLEGWNMDNNIAGTVAAGSLGANITGLDPFMTSPAVNISANAYSYMYLRVKNNTAQTIGELFWTTNISPSFDALKKVRFTLPPNDGLFHDLVIDLSSNLNWADNITGLRIDPTDLGNSGTMSFDHISLEKVNLMDCNGVWNGTSNPVTPAVAITLTSGSNPACVGSPLTFTATRKNGGSSPIYQWKVNSNNVGTNTTTFSSSTLKNSDVVSCMLISNAICANPLTATSNSIVISVKEFPVPNAGTDKFVTSSSTNLGANAPLAGEVGVWSTTSTATITKTSDPISMVSNLSNGATIFRWTLDNGPCSAFNEVTINKGVAPVITTITGPDFFDPGVVYTYSINLNIGSNYKWTIPPGATITANNGNSVKISFLASSNGNLSVTETNPYGSATSNKAVSIKITAGIVEDESSDNYFLIFPNPLNENTPLKIVSERTKKVKIKIVDMEGAILYFSEEFYTNESIIAQEKLPSGVLFLIINHNEGVSVKKIIK